MFRGFTGEDLIRPYVSQFLLKPFNYGPYAMSGTMGMYVPGIDYMTDQASWLAVQNGQGPFAPNMPGTVRYTCTGRGRHTDASDNGEINKLASNIGLARDFAGIHWRSDYEWGLKLGEAVAISVLRDQRNNYVGEDFEGFTITKFDGTTIMI